MKAPAELIADLMKRVERDFYSGHQAKYWHGQKQLVMKALLYPARWLGERKVELPAARYEAIVAGILDTARRHGRLGEVKYMSGYLLGVVQKHMEHHGEEYYREGVAVRNRVSLAMTAVERARAGADGTIPTLERAEQVLAIGKRKAKVKERGQLIGHVPKEPQQGSLF